MEGVLRVSTSIMWETRDLECKCTLKLRYDKQAKSLECKFCLGRKRAYFILIGCLLLRGGWTKWRKNSPSLLRYNQLLKEKVKKGDVLLFYIPLHMPIPSIFISNYLNLDVVATYVTLSSIAWSCILVKPTKLASLFISHAIYYDIHLGKKNLGYNTFKKWWTPMTHQINISNSYVFK